MTPSEKLKTYEKSWTEDGDLGEGDEDGVLWLIQRCKTLEAALKEYALSEHDLANRTLRGGGDENT